LGRRGLALSGCPVFLPMAHRREPAAKGRGIRLRNAEDLQAEGSTVEPAGTEALARDG
jgi:hypothetical protein